MDNTTQDIIKLYEEIGRLGILSYLSQYHCSLINKWNNMLLRSDCNNDEYKTIRNILYSLFILLLDSTTSRNNFIDFCLETIKTHDDTTILSQYTILRTLFDSFDHINRMNNADYNQVVDLLMLLYNNTLNQQDKIAIHRYVSMILIRYDPTNKCINNILYPTNTEQEIDIDDVVKSIYGK